MRRFFLIFIFLFLHSKAVFAQTPTPTPVCTRFGGRGCAENFTCDSSCMPHCPAGYTYCSYNCGNTSTFCIVPDIACQWVYWDGSFSGGQGECCCPIPTLTVAPTLTPTPVCDPACGQGVCGIRYWDNRCIADWRNGSCCHQACVGVTCQWVVGAGSFSCNACMPTSTPATTPGATVTPGTSTPTPIPTGVCNSFSSVRTFTYNTTTNPWWQTKDGDVHAEGSITSAVPSGEYLSEDGAGGMPGIVSFRNGSLAYGLGSLSSKGWQANTSTLANQTGYDYLYNKFNVNPTPIPDPGKIPVDSGIYLWDGTDLNLNGRTITGNKKIIIFATGNIKVGPDDLIVEEGSFFALISKGTISFGVNVNRAEGFYLADGTLTVSAKTSGGNDVRFFGEGSFIGLGGVSLPRDLGPGNQNANPAEYFTSRPDLYINAPAEFQYSPSFFQEVAP